MLGFEGLGLWRLVCDLSPDGLFFCVERCQLDHGCCPLGSQLVITIIIIIQQQPQDSIGPYYRDIINLSIPPYDEHRWT